MRHQGFLQFYKICLQLYPAKFRGRYAEQMYLIASDMLQHEHALSAAGRLLSDTCISILAEHIKQLGGNSVKSSRKSISATVGGAVWLGVQIVALPTLAYVSIMPILTYFPAPVYQPLPDVIGYFVPRFLPLVMIALTFRMLRELRLGSWNRMLASFVIGFAGVAFCHGSNSFLEPRLWGYFSSVYQPFPFLYDWLGGAIYVTAFYVAGTKVVGRLAIKPAKTTT
jgi:hypothetical protein